MEWKWRLTRRLYELGLGKKDVQELFRLIDWLIRLPDEKEVEFRQKVTEYKEQNAMPNITSIERLSRQEGRQEGRQEAIIQLLKLRHKRLPAGLIEAVGEISDEGHIGRLLLAAAQSSSIEEFSKSL